MSAAPVSSGGSSAPSANTSSGAGGASGGQSGPGQGDGRGGAGLDPGGALQEARAARAEAQRLRTTFDRHQQETRQDRETISRVREAFSPQQKESAPDPIADIEQQMDYYLEQAMEAKSRGQAIPLTTNLALRTFQHQIENLRFQQEIRDAVKELKGATQQANSPERTINDQAYGQMENEIQNQLDRLYGTDPNQLGTKRSVYDSVVRLLQGDLTELQQKHPAQWDRLRRNPQQLASVVQNAVQRMMPPKALQIIQQEHLQNTPMELGELWAAFRQVDQRKDISPEERHELKGQIRRDILELQMNGRRRRR